MAFSRRFYTKHLSIIQASMQGADPAHQEQFGAQYIVQGNVHM